MTNDLLAPQPPASSAVSSAAQGYTELVREHYDAARTAFTAVLDRASLDPAEESAAAAGAAAALAGLALFQQADRMAARALALAPSHPLALAVKAYITDVADHAAQEAVSLFQQAIQANATGSHTIDMPSQALVFLLWGQFLHRYHHDDEALQALQAALGIDPTLWRARITIGQISGGAPGQRTALEGYQQGLRWNPRSLRLRLGATRCQLLMRLPFGAAPRGSTLTNADQAWIAQRLLTRRQRPWLTYIVLAIIALVWLVIETPQGSTSTNVLIQDGAKVDALIAQGEWWRLISPIFLHAGAEHFGVNALSIWFILPLVESIFGMPRALYIFLFSGITGNLASFLFSIDVSVGASTAIAGLIGALVVFFATQRRLLGRYGLSQLRWLLVMIGLNAVFGLSSMTVDNYGHLGGLLGGIIAGVVLSPRLRLTRDSHSADRSLRDDRTATVVLANALALAGLLAIVILTMLHRAPIGGQ